MDWSDWEEQITDIKSSVVVKCTEGGVVSDTTCIHNFSMRGKVGCFCDLKTEGLHYSFLVDTYGEAHVRRQVREVPNPTTGRYSRYDFLVHDAFVVELDGLLGHFGTHKLRIGNRIAKKYAPTNAISVILCSLLCNVPQSAPGRRISTRQSRGSCQWPRQSWRDVRMSLPRRSWLILRELD
jgi:hypothetical protein